MYSTQGNNRRESQSARTLVTLHSWPSAMTRVSCAASLLLLLLLPDILLSSRARPSCCQIPAAGSPPRLCTTHSPPGGRAALLLLLLLHEEVECSGRRKQPRESSGAPRKLAAGTNARAERDAEASIDTAQEPQALMVR